ncbi:MAG TPA: hypothetical protein VGD83_23210, partial [Streptosporangiaceae bacterium]
RGAVPPARQAHLPLLRIHHARPPCQGKRIQVLRWHPAGQAARVAPAILPQAGGKDAEIMMLRHEVSAPGARSRGPVGCQNLCRWL